MAKRRGNQEGSIYKRKGGLWCVQVSLNNHRLTQYFKTRREAREWLTETLEQIQTGQSIESGRISLADFLGKWLDFSQAVPVSQDLGAVSPDLPGSHPSEPW